MYSHKGRSVRQSVSIDRPKQLGLYSPVTVRKISGPFFTCKIKISKSNFQFVARIFCNRPVTLLQSIKSLTRIALLESVKRKKATKKITFSKPWTPTVSRICKKKKSNSFRNYRNGSRPIRTISVPNICKHLPQSSNRQLL